MKAGTLKQGDKLSTISSEVKEVSYILRHEEMADVYNIEVADNHNYYVSSKQLLVHNKNIIDNNENDITMVNSKETKYYDFLCKMIVSENKVGIHEVVKIESNRTFVYSQTVLNKITEALVHNKPLPYDDAMSTDTFREYLDVFNIYDERGRRFYVLVYDSDELSQNPTILKIIRQHD